VPHIGDNAESTRRNRSLRSLRTRVSVLREIQVLVNLSRDCRGIDVRNCNVAREALIPAASSGRSCFARSVRCAISRRAIGRDFRFPDLGEEFSPGWIAQAAEELVRLQVRPCGLAEPVPELFCRRTGRPGRLGRDLVNYGYPLRDHQPVMRPGEFRDVSGDFWIAALAQDTSGRARSYSLSAAAPVWLDNAHEWRALSGSVVTDGLQPGD
jgi:hypothetical protein